MKNRLKHYKLKLLPDTNKVSGSHITLFVKEKSNNKGMIVMGKYTSHGRIYLIVNTKMKIKMNIQMKYTSRDAIINVFNRYYEVRIE